MSSNLANPPEPDGDLKRRILTAIRSEATPNRQELGRRNVILLATGAVVALAVFFGFGGMHVDERPKLLVAATCLGWVAAAAVALQLSFVRRRSMLGRPTAWLVALIASAPLFLFAWKLAVTSRFGAAMMERWPDRDGYKCLGLTLGMGVALLAVLTAARRRTDPVRPGITGAALGMAAGIAAGALVDLWCPVAHWLHLLRGHILPLVALAALGALAGRRFVRV